MPRPRGTGRSVDLVDAVWPHRTEAPLPSGHQHGQAGFFTGLGLTAVASGLTVWSGIDAENHPGRDAVRADCVGQGAAVAFEIPDMPEAALRTMVAPMCLAQTLAVGLTLTLD